MCKYMVQMCNPAICSVIGVVVYLAKISCEEFAHLWKGWRESWRGWWNNRLTRREQRTCRIQNKIPVYGYKKSFQRMVCFLEADADSILYCKLLWQNTVAEACKLKPKEVSKGKRWQLWASRTVPQEHLPKSEITEPGPIIRQLRHETSQATIINVESTANLECWMFHCGSSNLQSRAPQVKFQHKF